MAFEYREPITIQRLKTSATPNALGESNVVGDENWEEYFFCWGALSVKGTREFTRAGILNADVSHLIIVPRSEETAAVNSEMRLLMEETGEILAIEEVYRRDSTNHEMVFLCRS